MAGKADIVDKVASSVDGMTKKSAAEAFDAVFDSIGRHLRKGERVQVTGFGSFYVSRRAARKGRNHATGQAITIKASKNVRFKAAKEPKEGLNKPRKRPAAVAESARPVGTDRFRSGCLRCSSPVARIAAGLFAFRGPELVSAPGDRGAPGASAGRRRSRGARSPSWWPPCGESLGRGSAGRRW